MSTRRILITTDLVGGVWDFTRLLAAELHARHHLEVTVLALGKPTRAHTADADVAQFRLVAAPLKLEWMQGAASDIDTTRRFVAQTAHDVGADVVHANQFAAACPEVDVPVVLTVHSDVLSWFRWTRSASADPVAWASYIRVVQDGLRRADAIVAVSAFLAREIADLYGVGRSIGVIHNGWPAPPSVVEQPRRGTLLAGRAWDEAKNIGLAARALGDEDMWLAGETRHPETGQAAEFGPRVQLLGPLPFQALQDRMQAVEIYLSPARYDPFGLLPLQAALNGCALLLSDIPSYREVWNGAACFFRADDAADLDRTWRLLHLDDSLRRELQFRAHERAVTAYSPGRMADAYMHAYAGACRAVAA